MTLSTKAGYVSSVKSVSEIPDGPHWVILSEEWVTTTSGYAEDNGSSEITMKYHVFTDEKEWLKTVLYLEEEKLRTPSYREQKFIAFHVDRRAKTQIDIKIV